MESFTATVQVEGSKGANGNLRITVPIKVMRPLIACGFQMPGWLHVFVDGRPFFGYARAPASRPYPNITLPRWAFGEVRPGQEVMIGIEDAARFRARLGAQFDWLSFVSTEHYLPIDEEGGVLALHSRYEPPFTLRRRFEDSAFWLLGYYQAEGSKSATAPDWTFATSSVEQICAARDALAATWGIANSRLYIEVLYQAGDDPEAARAHYAKAALDVASTRQRSGSIGDRQAVLHVRSSKPLLRMTKAMLAHVFEKGWPSAEAAKRYTLGWLDGDGNITRQESTVELRLAGLADEHRVLQQALRDGFGWKLDKGSGHIDVHQGTHISLRASEMAELLEAGAFWHSMNRAKLLLAFDDRTASLRRHAREGVFDLTGWARNVFLKWGLVEQVTGGFRVSALGQRVCAAHERLADEIAKVKAVVPERGVTGIKNAPYPDVGPRPPRP